MLKPLLLVSGTEVFARLGGCRLVFPAFGSFWIASLFSVSDPTSRAATEGEAPGPHRLSLCEVPVFAARYPASMLSLAMQPAPPVSLFLCFSADVCLLLGQSKLKIMATLTCSGNSDLCYMVVCGVTKT